MNEILKVLWNIDFYNMEFLLLRWCLTILYIFSDEGPWLSSNDVCDLIDTRLKESPFCSDCNENLDRFFTETRAKLGLNVGNSRPVEYAPEDYVGMYGDYAYGNVTIDLDSDNGGLIMVYGVEKFT